MLPGSSLNGSPRLASLAAAVMRFFSLSASRLASALARSSAFELDMRWVPTVITRLVRNCALERVIQYSRVGGGHTRTPRRAGCPVLRGMTSYRTVPPQSDAQFRQARTRRKQQCEAADAVEALDPGVPYESRWAPYVRAHGPGQGQFPKGSIRPRGYMAPDARRSLALTTS